MSSRPEKKDLKKFDIDLARGQVGEALVEEILQGGYKIECKRDFMACDTGNVVIEFESRKKPSGIAVTTADWWAFILAGKMKDDVVVMVKTSKLKEYITDKKPKWVCGGDGKTSRMYVIKIADLLKI